MCVCVYVCVCDRGWVRACVRACHVPTSAIDMFFVVAFYLILLRLVCNVSHHRIESTHFVVWFSFVCLAVRVARELVCVQYVICTGLERRTRDRKLAGSSPGRSGGRIFFSMVNFLCRLFFFIFFFLLLFFQYPFHPRVTAVARRKVPDILPKVQGAGYS